MFYAQVMQLRAAVDPVHLNLSRCYLKLERYRDALKHAANATAADSTNVTRSKSYYLRGKAYLGLKEYELALEFLSKSLLDFPSDKSQ